VLSARLGHFLDKPLGPFAKKIAIHPNVLTVAGFVITVMAALVIPVHLRLGGVLILLGGICDLGDGILARTNDRMSKFGAFLDSLLDRYSDSFLFLSIAWYFGRMGNFMGASLSIGAMVGAFLVSYARARGEGLGIQSQVGIMERPERIILLIIATLTGWLTPVLWVMCILTHITVIQRAYVVWKAEQ